VKVKAKLLKQFHLLRPLFDVGLMCKGQAMRNVKQFWESLEIGFHRRFAFVYIAECGVASLQVGFLILEWEYQQ
jgi:hypothetical protein